MRPAILLRLVLRSQNARASVTYLMARRPLSNRAFLYSRNFNISIVRPPLLNRNGIYSTLLGISVSGVCCRDPAWDDALARANIFPSKPHFACPRDTCRTENRDGKSNVRNMDTSGICTSGWQGVKPDVGVYSQASTIRKIANNMHNSLVCGYLETHIRNVLGANRAFVSHLTPLPISNVRWGSNHYISTAQVLAIGLEFSELSERLFQKPEVRENFCFLLSSISLACMTFTCSWERTLLQ